MSGSKDLQPPPRRPLFNEILGADFERLPSTVKQFHTIGQRHHWSGEAEVRRGGSLIAALVCRVFGFPPTATRIPVTVKIEENGSVETWHRRFGQRIFVSTLTVKGVPGSGVLRERFGAFSFDIELSLKGRELCFPVIRARFLGIPLPGWLLPTSDTRETEEDGHFIFDVALSLLMVGPLVHYSGWLQPISATTQS
ncbi:MAG: DUF4166 domain-containing protein [Roseibium sp.]|nr:DUF4166 domain-containing protein [Roseibium sp.]MBO6930681.1 DUF4166 domain-containing protein [Roseibium sp.]